MSGKGKRKDRIKPKPDEIKLFDKCINLIRFGYDVIKYTALRFHVPESCIAVWEGKRNEYGYDDFCSVMCMGILEYQIKNRGKYHVYFLQRYEENKLADSEQFSSLMYKVIDEVTCGFTMSPLHIVPISLSISCELFLFLYSKNVVLHPKQLATAWFECYLKIKKKGFGNKGLQEIYCISSMLRGDIKNAFLGTFIEDHCLSYNTSATNSELEEIFGRSLHEYLLPKYIEEMKKEYKPLNEISDQLTGLKIKIEPPAPDGATGFNPPENTGGPLDQVSQFCGSLLASSQDLLSPEELPRHRIIFSKQERKKLLKSKSPFEQSITQLTLDSSETKKSSDKKPSVSIATGTTQSYEHQGVRPKVPLQNTGSSGLQTGESSSRSSRKQSLRQLCSDSSERKQSSDQKPSVSIATGTTQSYEHQGVRPKNPLQNTGSSSLQTGESSSGSSRKQSRR